MQQPVQQFTDNRETNTSCTFSRRAQIFIESWKMLSRSETIKTAAYLPKAIFFHHLGGRRKGSMLLADILHISKHDLFRCESHPKDDEMFGRKKQLSA